MGGKSSTSTSQVSIPPQVLAQYNTVTSQANALMGTNPATGQPNTPFQFYSTNPNAFVAPLDPTQQAGIAGTNYYANAAQPYYQGATDLTLAGAGPANLGALQTNRYMSPFLSDVYGTQLAGEQMLNQQQASGLQGQAIQAGAFGGDRSGVAAANLAYQQNLANNQTNAGLLQAGYTQAQNTAAQQQAAQLAAQQANLARLTSAGAQLGGLGTAAQTAGLQGAQAQQAAGLTQQQTAQAGLQALYNQFLQAQAYPFQTLGELANISEGIGALSGSTTTSTQPSSFFSDERLKEDIQPIGETYDGQKIVKFKYKGKPGKQIGLIAQDVEKHHPDAVGLMGGYKTVDYDRATDEAAHRGHFYSGGLVPSSEGGAVGIEHAGEGFADGGMPGVAAQQLNLYSNLGLIPGKGNPYMPSTGSGGLGGMGGGQPRQLMVAHEPTQKPPTMADAAQSMSNWANLGEKGDAALFGKTGDGGLVGGIKSLSQGFQNINAGGTFGGNSQEDVVNNLRSKYGDPSQPPPVASDASPSTNYRGGRIHEAHGGLVPRHPYAAGGISTPYENTGDDSKGYMGEAQDAQPAPPKQLQTASTPSQGPSGAQQLGSLAGGIGGLASGVGMAASGLSKLLPLLAARNGGFIHEPYHDDAPHHHGGGEGLMGFGALAARRRAAGGLVGRKGYDDGGAPDDTPGGAPDDTQGGAQNVSSSGLSLSDILNAGQLNDIRNRNDQAPQVGLAATSPVTPPAAPPQGGVVGPSGTVTQQTPEGPGAFDKGGWMERNQSWLVPLLSGIGGMASSNSRYLGSALLQGLGAGAQAYEGVQGQMAQRARSEAETTAIPQRLAIDVRTQDQQLLEALIRRKQMYGLTGSPPELDNQINALISKIGSQATPGVAPYKIPPSQGGGALPALPGGPIDYSKLPSVTANDRDQMIRTVLGEAGGEGPAGMRGVAHNIINRSALTGASLTDVVHAPGQYEPWATRADQLNQIDPNSPEYKNAAAEVDAALADPTKDTTGGSRYFLAPHVMAQRGQPFPAWANGAPSAVIGGHNFYGASLPNEPRPQQAAQAQFAAPIQAAQSPDVSRIMQDMTPTGTNAPKAPVITASDVQNLQIARNAPNYNQAADPARLTAMGNSAAANGNPELATQMWSQARAELSRLTQTGEYLDTNNHIQTVPGFFERQAASLRVPQNADFFKNMANNTQERIGRQGILDAAKAPLSAFRTGSYGEFQSWLNGLTGGALFPNAKNAVEVINKEAQNTIASNLTGLGLTVGLTDFQQASAGKSTINPTADPNTNRTILAQMQAVIDYQSMYTRDALAAAKAADHNGVPFDQARFATTWESSHPGLFSQLMNEAKYKIPIRGVGIDNSAPIGSMFVAEPGTRINGQDITRPGIIQKTDKGWAFVKFAGE